MMAYSRRVGLSFVLLATLLWVGWRQLQGSRERRSSRAAHPETDYFEDAVSIARQALTNAGYSKRAGLVRGLSKKTHSLIARNVQSLLDCVSSEGKWMQDDSSMNRSRLVHQMDPIYGKCERARSRDPTLPDSSLYAWRPDPECLQRALGPDTLAQEGPSLSRILPKMTRRRFCDTMRHQSVYIVGDSLQFSLHELLLDIGSRDTQMCYGEQYCGTHWFCGREDFGYEEDDAWVSSHGPAELDSYPLSIVHGHEKRRTLHGETLDNFARLRFRRSDNLWPLTSTHETGRILGIREKEERNRIEGKAVRDTTFRQHPLLHASKMDLWLPDMGRSRLAIIGRGAILDPHYDEQRFSQELVEALAKSSRYSLANPEGETLIVWRGDYLPHPLCEQPESRIPHADSKDTALSASAEQKKLILRLKRQNAIAREVIGAFGGLYWDTASALETHRDGHIGPLKGGFDHPPVDCWRYCIPGPTDHWLDIMFWLVHWANGLGDT